MKKLLLTPMIAALAASQLGATDCGQITRDPGFDVWCGDHLCAWKVERGSVERVPTWNEGDPGVQLVGDDVAIEQLTPVTSGDTTCIQFHLIANVALDAQVMVNIDINGDGKVDRTEQIPTVAWQPFDYLIAVAPPYAGVRFEIAKQGSGEAEIAMMQAKVSTDCGTIPPVDPRPITLGSPCNVDADCASGICRPTFLDVPFSIFGVANVCEGCNGDSCGSGDVCGAGAPNGATHAGPDVCLPAASKGLEQTCETGAECASGICTDAVCSTCDDTHACANGELCEPAYAGAQAASECSPGLGKRASGEPCVTDDDCMSSTCSGTVAKRCDDGRTCASDLDCPFEDPPGGDGTLINGPCTVVGVESGTCT